MLPDYAEPNVDRVSSLRPACVIRPDLHLIEHGPLAPLITGWAKSATKWKFCRYFKDYLLESGSSRQKVHFRVVSQFLVVC